jgi:hypothetical protein
MQVPTTVQLTAGGASRVGREPVTGAHNDPPPHRYRIRVSGRLGETIRSPLPSLQVR